MNLRSSEPFWPFHTPVKYSYPSLCENITTHAVVVGSGITGALAAYELIRAGVDVTMITKGRPGSESTSATTALLQYEIDTPLHRLTELVGQEQAERSYILCHDSIDALKKIHKAVGVGKVFHKRKSLLLASLQKDVPDLEKEYQMRSAIGIRMEWMDEEEVEGQFGFAAPAAIYSGQGADTDAYLCTQELIHWCCKKGMRMYDNAEMTAMKETPRGVSLETAAGHSIHARYVVIAAGYESTKWIDRRVARLHSTYAIISKPVPKSMLWRDRALIWETAHPYIYMRTTDDHRMIIGGKDEPFNSAHKRDALITQKSKLLQEAFYKKFPDIPFDIDYAWAGTFGETADGLPFIGPAAPRSRILFSLGYGGNGITFSQIGAVIIRDIITGRKNPDTRLFSFDRMNYRK